MDHYQGAVLYLDILGISNLTKKKVKLTPEDYEAWGITKRSEWNEHFFCAKLLVAFRSCLEDVKERYGNIKVTQLSDCAFIWSKDAAAVARAAQDLMWALIRAGVLCRGGIAYGEIIEPDRVLKSIGQFVLGEAVTMAVECEGKGKGCRIFTEPELALQLTGTGPRSDRFPVKSFAELRNPLSGESADEFRWYLQNLLGGPVVNDQAKHLALLELMAALMCSPRFNWNATSEAGRLQLACSIACVSEATHTLLPSSDTVFSVNQLMVTTIKRTPALQSKRLQLWASQAASAFDRRKATASKLSGALQPDL